MGPDPMSVRYRFGPHELDPATQRLLRDGLPLRLPSRGYELLQLLVERRHRVVGKAELADALWPRGGTDRSELARLVRILRRLLGEEAILTLPGHGWRFTPVLADEVAEPLRLTPAHLPAAADAPLLPGELPRPPLRPLLGREADLAALAAMLPERRLISLVGEEGIGKSQLALHLLAHRPGVAWVDLSALPWLSHGANADPGSTPSHDEGGVSAAVAVIAATIARSLGAHHPVDDPLADLAHGLRLLDVPSLWLVLDETSQNQPPRDAVAEVVRVLLASAAPLRVLWLGLAPLEQPGESVYRLHPLPLPEPDADFASARECSALRLLAMQARRSDRSHELDLRDDAVRGHACRLVRHLHGVPMALELAGARLPALGALRLLDELEQRSQRPGGAAPSPLRALMRWTLERLAAEEAGTLRLLEAIAERLQVVTLEALLDEPDEAVAVAARADALDALIDLALVQLLPSPQGDADRYRLLGAWHALLRTAT